MTRTSPRAALLAAAAGAGALILVAAGLPAFGRDALPAAAPTVAPAATRAPAGGTADEKPRNGPKTDRPGRGNVDPKPVEVPVTLRGRVGTRVDEDGATVYALTVDGTRYELEAGPPWWWGDRHPLAAVVGQIVTIAGEQTGGTRTVDVLAIDGITVREAGRPDWAGGPKAVGEAHPGWKGWWNGRGAGSGAGAVPGKQHGGGRPPWGGPKTPEETPAP